MRGIKVADLITGAATLEPSYKSACRELAWRSFARNRGWLEYDESLPSHWGFSRWLYLKWYDFRHRNVVVPELKVIPFMAVRYSSFDGIRIFQHPFPTGEKSKSIDLFTLEKSLEKRIVFVGQYAINALESLFTEEQWKKMTNARADILPEWDHVELADVIVILGGGWQPRHGESERGR